MGTLLMGTLSAGGAGGAARHGATTHRCAWRDTTPSNGGEGTLRNCWRRTARRRTCCMLMEMTEHAGER